MFLTHANTRTARNVAQKEKKKQNFSCECDAAKICLHGSCLMLLRYRVYYQQWLLSGAIFALIYYWSKTACSKSVL